VDDDVGIRARNNVDLTIGKLSFEYRALLNDDVDLELICRDVRLHRDNIVLLVFNHGLEVHIDFYTKSSVVFLPQSPLLFDVIHSAPTFLPVNL